MQVQVKPSVGGGWFADGRASPNFELSPIAAESSGRAECEKNPIFLGEK